MLFEYNLWYVNLIDYMKSYFCDFMLFWNYVYLFFSFYKCVFILDELVVVFNVFSYFYSMYVIIVLVKYFENICWSFN